MFVKLEYENLVRILNVDNISAIYHTRLIEGSNDKHFIVMNNGIQYDINEEQYEQLCKVLTKTI